MRHRLIALLILLIINVLPTGAQITQFRGMAYSFGYNTYLFTGTTQYPFTAYFDSTRTFRIETDGTMKWGSAGDVNLYRSAANTLKTDDSLTVGGTLAIADGLVGSPSITHPGDTDTGVYFPAANQVAFTVQGGAGLRIEGNATTPNVIGGLSLNRTTSGVVGATIAGGGWGDELDDQWNQVTDNYGTVGGGRDNQAGDAAGTVSDAMYATVGGGISNKALANGSVVAGGTWNEATAYCSAVLGGDQNYAQGNESVVGGGFYNFAKAQYSMVLGGRANNADATYSFASGRRAKVGATHSGAFLWADSTDLDFASSIANEFAVRATGGLRLVTAVDGAGVPTKSVAIDANGTLNMTSTTGALIVPRMTTTQRDALTPVNGMIIYNTTTNAFNFYENSAWVAKANL